MLPYLTKESPEVRVEASASFAPDRWLGRLMGGRWRVVSLLDDSGGMASVYLANDERLPRKAVVKIPKAAQFNAEFAERFDREAHWHAQVSDRNVVHILDRGEEEGTPYLVLQYLPGGNLKAWCDRNPSLLADPRLHYDAWLLPIAQALDTVSAQGIVHRDVKPSNILFDASGRAYLSDFGIVKAGNDATMTGTGLFIGTLHYMSPEQCHRDGKQVLDGRSDQYGLAVTVYQVLTGWKYPVENDTAVVYAAKFGLSPMTAAVEHDKRIPQAVSDAVMRALSADRSKRFGSCVEFAGAVFAGFERGRERLRMARATAPPSQPGTPAVVKTPMPRGWHAAATAMVILGAAGLLVTLYFTWIKTLSLGGVLEEPVIVVWHMLLSGLVLASGLQLFERSRTAGSLRLAGVVAVLLMLPVWAGFFPFGILLGGWVRSLVSRVESASHSGSVASPEDSA